MKVKHKINGKVVSRAAFLKNLAPAGAPAPKKQATYDHSSMAAGVQPWQVDEANAHAAKHGFGDVQYQEDGRLVMKNYNPGRWRAYLKTLGAHESGAHG